MWRGLRKIAVALRGWLGMPLAPADQLAFLLALKLMERNGGHLMYWIAWGQNSAPTTTIRARFARAERRMKEGRNSAEVLCTTGLFEPNVCALLRAGDGETDAAIEYLARRHFAVVVSNRDAVTYRSVDALISDVMLHSIDVRYAGQKAVCDSVIEYRRAAQANDKSAAN